MSDRFDELSRRMAQPLPRRGALKAIGGALIGGAALTVLRPFRGDAICVGIPCGSSCCHGVSQCLNAATSTCGCPAGSKECGAPNLCCPAGGACSKVFASRCCCPAATTPCGGKCCTGGTACLDAAADRCGCAAGQTTCLYGNTVTCCAGGTTCPPTPTCAGPPTSTPATCIFVRSDRQLKEHIVPVVWD